MFYRLKTVFLLGLLTGVFLAVGLVLGGTSGMIIAFIFALFMNFISYWFSDRIVLAMYRAKEADKEKHAKLYDAVNYVVERAKIPMPKVYIIPSGQPNAFATGRNPKNAVVAVTKGIMELLNEKELRAVIAHEVAHVKNRDILVASIAAVIAGAISFIANMASWVAIFGGFSGNDEESGTNIIGVLALAIVTPLIATLIHMAISRSREFLADKEGAKFIRDGNALADALQKLNAGTKHNKMDLGTEGTAHMFIVNPFTANKFLNLFSTHPPINERIGRLRSMNF